MKVEAIRLINFMAFEDTGWIELRPITLLFGRNSSGKSAIIRALLLLKQSLDARGEEQPLAFVKEDGLVDLGNFQTTVHRKPGEGPSESQQKDYLERSIVFGFRCDLTGETALDQMRDLLKSGPAVSLSEEALKQLVRVELLIGFGLYEDSVKPNLLSLCAVGAESPVVLLQCARVAASDLTDVSFQHIFVLNSDVASDPNLDERTASLHLRDTSGFWTTFAAPLAPSSSFEKLDKLLFAVQAGVEAFLRKIAHIGPIRPQPERMYALRATDAPRYARDGLEGWYDFLRNRVAETDKATAITKWMRRLGLADKVNAWADGDKNPITRSQILIDDKVANMNVKDVGFGASQVLPVIVAAVLAEPDSLVIIEQPELHLHTSAQIELGELFTRTLRTGARFLIESHSEHMLLRFQRNVAISELLRLKCNQRSITRERFKPPIKAIEVVVLFIERNHKEGLSTLETIFLQDDGQVLEPSSAFQDFFRQDYDEVNAILSVTAQLRSLKEQR